MRRTALSALLIGTLARGPLLAQEAGPVVPPASAAPRPADADGSRPLRWWHGAIVGGGLVAIGLLDPPVQRYAQDHRGKTGDDVSRAFRRMGQPEVYATVGLGLLGAGLLAGKPDLARSGGRVTGSLVLAGLVTSGTKEVFGRPRPNASLDADEFRPFSGQNSFPSGHATLAFALATSLSDEIHRPWATVGLYTFATGTAWSRLNDNKHWLSDVVAGAAVGVVSAKLINGRWRIFHLRSPSFLIGPSGNPSVGWRASF